MIDVSHISDDAFWQVMERDTNHDLEEISEKICTKM
jgi:microsomal dipeptidase-like Zn-dependent dipeptidase